MCYGCTRCNKCGKYDWLAGWRRRCPTCKKEPPPEALICPDCGARLPPPIPGPPGGVSLQPKEENSPGEEGSKQGRSVKDSD